MKRTTWYLTFVALALVLSPATGVGQTTKTRDPIDALQPKMSDPLDRLLALDEQQKSKLTRAYEDFARTRLGEEARIGGWHEFIQDARAKTPPDERAIRRNEQEIQKAERRILDALKKARANGLKILRPGQRDWLKWLWSHHRVGPHDRYCLLLIAPAEEMWRHPIDSDVAMKLLTKEAFDARSPRPYRYFSAPETFHAYGHRMGESSFGRHTTIRLFRF